MHVSLECTMFAGKGRGVSAWKNEGNSSPQMLHDWPALKLAPDEGPLPENTKQNLDTMEASERSPSCASACAEGGKKLPTNTATMDNRKRDFVFHSHSVSGVLRRGPPTTTKIRIKIFSSQKSRRGKIRKGKRSPTCDRRGPCRSNRRPPLPSRFWSIFPPIKITAHLLLTRRSPVVARTQEPDRQTDRCVTF